MKYFLLLLLVFVNLHAKDLQKVSLQLQWLDQFQFAGYYMAKEKGFYKDAGLDVEIKKMKYSLSPVDEVLLGRATFGIGRSSLIRLRSNNKKIVLISAIFQSSPFMLISLKSSNINSIGDFVGKKLMLTDDAVETASIHAMINSSGINESELSFKEHTFDIEELIDGRVDLYAAYTSNEPYLLKQRGIPYKIFSPKDAGFDFYSDILFTSETEVHNNPKRVKAFKNASLKGWEYAFRHINETVNLIHEKYNSQNKTKNALIFEANELKKLAYISNTKIGDLDTQKIKRILDVYNIMGMAGSGFDIRSFIFDDKYSLLSLHEHKYLKNKKEIKICVAPNSLPYSGISNGKFVGIGAGVLDLVEEYTEIPFKLIETKTWNESISKALNRECDILPLAEDSPHRRKYFKYTTPYYYEPLAIVTKKTKNYILDINTILDKEFSVVKGNSFIERLQKKYPYIKLHVVNSLKEGFLGVESGKYYGHIDIMMSCAYEMQHLSKIDLKISGQFEDSVEVSFAVRSDDEVLFDIFEKIARNLELSDLQKILNDWVSVNYSQNVEFKYLREIVGFILLIVFIFFYRQHILNKKNRELEKLQDKLVELNSSLETKISDSTSDLQKAQKIAKIGSWVYDLQKDELRWSSQVYEIFEIDPQEDGNLYKKFINRVHPDDRDILQSSFLKSLKEKRDYKLGHRLLMNDGSIKYVDENCETTFSDSGIPLISYGTVQDVTQSVEAKIEIKKKDAYLLHRSRLAQMGEVLSMISHQWKQPLGSISATQIAMTMAIELETYNLNDEKQREDFLDFLLQKLEKIGSYTQSLSLIISNFSDFYKPNKKPIRMLLDDVVVKAYKLAEYPLESYEIYTELDLHSEAEVEVYENEFMQVVLNILNNARDQFLQKKIAANPKILIKTHDEEKKVILEISDNAGGIPKDIIKNVFDPYFSTKLEKNGTGLGLHMSKNIIEEHHCGKISVKNIEDGAIFIIEIKKGKLVDE